MQPLPPAPRNFSNISDTPGKIFPRRAVPISRILGDLTIATTRLYGKQRKAAAAAADGARPRGSAAITLILSWLIPGYGFIRNGHIFRGLSFFVLLQLTFAIGASLSGTVFVPEFNFRAIGFNLINILTFITQMFNGGLGLVSMLPEVLGPGAAILPYDEAATYADLGTFYLLVSGGMNYFVLVSTWDNFYRVKPLRAENERGN